MFSGKAPRLQLAEISASLGHSDPQTIKRWLLGYEAEISASLGQSDPQTIKRWLLGYEDCAQGVHVQMLVDMSMTWPISSCATSSSTATLSIGDMAGAEVDVAAQISASSMESMYKEWIECTVSTGIAPVLASPFCRKTIITTTTCQPGHASGSLVCSGAAPGFQSGCSLKAAFAAGLPSSAPTLPIQRSSVPHIGDELPVTAATAQAKQQPPDRIRCFK